jgi:hypothetical protein
MRIGQKYRFIPLIARLIQASLCSGFLIHAPISGNPLGAPAPAFGEPQELVIHNRILARVSNKTISVLDLVKKMDVFLNAHLPQVLESQISRFQFYMSNWQGVLDQMIDAELILNDVGEKDLKITEGEVREGIMEKFGPNVMTTLDKCGLTYEEARQIIRDELILQRMNWFKVHAKALQQVGPQEIRDQYKNFLAQHPSEEEWMYQVISIRSAQAQLSEQIAKDAFSLLQNAKIDLAGLKQTLEGKKQSNETLVFTISEDITATERTISHAHRKGLEGLNEGEYSQPILQTSGNEKNPVQRIFLLKHHGMKPVPSFQSVLEELKRKRLDEVIAKEDESYRQKLRVRYGHLLFLEELPPSFAPFSLEF